MPATRHDFIKALIDVFPYLVVRRYAAHFRVFPPVPKVGEWGRRSFQMLFVVPALPVPV